MNNIGWKRAEFKERADFAAWFPRLTYSAAMLNNPVREARALFPRHKADQIQFDFVGILVSSQIESAAHATHMSVNHNGGFPIRVAYNDICSFATNSRQGSQIFDAVGNLPFEPLHQLPTTSSNRLGFVAEESRALDLLLQYRLYRRRPVLRGLVLLEELGSQHIHADVGTLGGENRCNQQLEGVRVVKRTFDLRVFFLENRDDFLDTGLEGAVSGIPDLDAFSGRRCFSGCLLARGHDSLLIRLRQPGFGATNGTLSRGRQKAATDRTWLGEPPNPA